MQVELPFFECPEDALRAAVQALGGAKQVGTLIWPEKTPDNAGRLLLDCLNPSRSEKLDIGQTMRLLRLARDIGFHGPMTWLCGEVGYEAKAVTKAEELDRVTTVVEQASKTLAVAVATLDRLQRARVVA